MIIHKPNGLCLEKINLSKNISRYEYDRSIKNIEQYLTQQVCKHLKTITESHINLYTGDTVEIKQCSICGKLII